MSLLSSRAARGPTSLSLSGDSDCLVRFENSRVNKKERVQHSREMAQEAFAHAHQRRILSLRKMYGPQHKEIAIDAQANEEGDSFINEGADRGRPKNNPSKEEGDQEGEEDVELCRMI